MTKHIFSTLAFIVGAAILFGSLVWVSGWLYSFRLIDTMPLPAEAGVKPLTPNVGEMLPGAFWFDLPLCRSVTDVSIHPGDGAVISNVQLKKGKWRFSRREWLVTFEVYSLRAGEIAPGTLTLTLAGKNPETVTRPIARFSAVLPSKPLSGELTLADPIEPEQSFPWGKLGAALAVLLTIGGWIVEACKIRRRPPTLPLKERMREALQQFDRELSQAKITPAEGYVKLTDLVRDYLEERYGISASIRTTTEVLTEINGVYSPLPESERPFLQEFLAAADQVKFAAITPDLELLNQAAKSAWQLIEATSQKDTKEAHR